MNLNPNRVKTHSVFDLVFNDIVYTGSYNDCLDFISEQPDYFTYDIIIYNYENYRA